ncbi:extracellular solute-binding protein [Ihubacter massiliensis]|uniref:Extracellular solute-binding protein n=1 Tax=Hominibacterium faecale TaxID=2839743 RepID=A0A9J6QWZ8_9FIRM|nr:MULTISPECIES: extracellular solute-binding protein [Eubacteriales Family XIII. Incertae Sedis]MCO7120722.1 extracellular solute-binding protein [Ihubacter massiliensis]MCU7380023.1 extracellular solute-binding protein [Hominibacterium faecale]MDY3012198.1 extracellular solute-binding protein [Clostridiales Family XIII bacterium]
METKKNRELKLIFIALCIVFAIFLAVPMIQLLIKSFYGDDGLSIQSYMDVLSGKGFLEALGNSFLVAASSAALTTCIAFFLSYTVNYTRVGQRYKDLIRKAAVLPMLLPTITYGFAIIYSFGKQGLLTRIFGHPFFEIYGFNGLLLGYTIYTLPISFMLINNTMGYIDKRFMIVSRIMGDSPLRTFQATILRPLLGTLAASFIQTFFLCFTDFGIPASVGGEFQVIASLLYNEMLGSIPNFGNGAVVALVMLVPSVVSITILRYLERYNVRYNKISAIEIQPCKGRDVVCGVMSGFLLAGILSIFAVILIIPFVKDWPYYTDFTLEHFQSVFSDPSLSGVYVNSLAVALATAVIGTVIAYGSALLTARSSVSQRLKSIIEGIALITNTIPGMVLGLAFLFSFSGTSLQNTLIILIICNIIHFYSTPYLMMKNSLSKMNASWETTAMLMGDNWLKTIARVVTPNAAASLLGVFSYYFINAMVTVSAVIFIAGARTMVITTKIKELQYFNKFNEIFVLSLLILATNLVFQIVFNRLAERSQNTEKKERKTKMVKSKLLKRATAVMLALMVGTGAFAMTGCGGSSDEQVIIYANSDDEAVEVMKKTLDDNGFEGQYLFQTFGTSELGGKLIAEGADMEADLVAMSSYYLDSAQEKNKMFKDLTFEAKTIDEHPSYAAPIICNAGSIIVNTEEMKANGLPVPKSIKDLADPVYKGKVSVTDVASSSTAWLLVQALVSEYGEEETKTILTGIYENVGPHLEESGSGPLKKIRAGEVSLGFGLRAQAVADKKEGLPIDYIDPTEGNFTLTESVAVLDKGDQSKEKAMEMAQCIVEKARTGLMEYYPVALYEGETVDSENKLGNPKTYSQPLTVDLLEQHQALSESCK